MKEKLAAFIYKDYYIYTIFALTYISWLFGFINTNLPAIGLIVITAFGGYILLTKKDTTPLIPIVCSCLFVVNGKMSYDAWPWWIIAIPSFLVIFLIIYLFKNKIQNKKSPILIGLIILGIASILPLIQACFTGDINRFDFLKIFLSLGAFLYVFVFFFFNNTIIGDNKEYLGKTILSLGVLIGLQLFTKYIEIGDFQYAYSHKEAMDLGWGIGNDAAIYLNMAICMGSYFLTKTKNIKELLASIAILGFLILSLLFTWSRTALLSLGIMAIPLLIFILKNSQYKKQIIILLASFFFLFILVGIIKPSLVFEPILNMLSKGVSLSGRTYLYDFAIELFKKFPIFGATSFPDVPLEVMQNAGIETNRIVVFHSIFFQTIATMGIIGLLALIFHLFQIIRLLSKNITTIRIFMIIMIIESFIQSTVDNVYFMVVFMVLFMIILSVIERGDDDFNKMKIEKKEEDDIIGKETL